MKNFVIVLLMFVAGCGTRNYKEFDFSNVPESQGVIIGKIDIKYNSQLLDTTVCKFCAGSACQSLLDDGYVFMPVEKGPLTQGRLYCSHPNFCCDVPNFIVESFEVGSGIIYFGNLIFTVIDTSPNPYTPPSRSTPVTEDPWVNYFDDYERRKMNGEVTSSADAIAKGVIRDTASSLYSAVFSSEVTSSQRAPYTVYFDVSVKDSMTDVIEVFRAQVKNKDIKVEKNIFNIKLETEQTTIYR